MKAVEIKPGIYWVGAKDWNLRDFHGYKTRRGSTYNAYLIVDEKTVLVDTVKSYLCDEMVARIRSVVDPGSIDCIVSNHVEMDHSGSLDHMLKLAPQAELLTSTNGEKGLQLHFDTSGWNMRAVQSGETLAIGKRTLAFTHIPLVHWPDSMVTYLPEDKLLIPNDAFGQHIATDGVFDDQEPLDIVMEEAAKYYANIILPYGIPVSKAMAAIDTLDFDMIAPSHGVIWRKHIAAIVDKYRFWTKHQHVNKAVVIYDTMWGSTERMAHEVKATFEKQDVPVTMRSLKHSHISDVIVDVLEAKYVAIGSPTLNNMILPTLGAFLTYMRGLKPENKTGFLFGSYGWNPKALEEVEAMLKGMGWNLPQPVVNTKYRPQADIIKKLHEAVAAVCNVT